MTDRKTLDQMTSDDLDDLHDLAARLANAVAYAYELTPAEVLAEAWQSIAEQRAAGRTK